MAITASTEELFKQAPMTAHDYMNHAIHDIDKLLGEGYAAKHPELIGAYMQTSAIDFKTSMLVVAIQEAARELASALDHS